MDIGIIGATGYGGADLIHILQLHPEVDHLRLYSSSQAGIEIQDSFPHLQRLTVGALEDIEPSSLGEKLDIVMMATPSGISAELAPRLLEQGLKVIDLSGDFRIKDPRIYQTWYKRQPAAAKWTQHAIYGLTEWAKEEIQEARLLPNPGCFPTAALLGLLPLVQHSLLKEDSIIVDAKTGVSGAGRGLSAAAHFAETNESLKTYKVNEHQHTPEIEQELSRYNKDMRAITFTPHLVPMTRGIMATMYAKAKSITSARELQGIFESCYESTPFIQIRKSDSYPATKEVYGSNQCDIGVTYDERSGTITVVSVIDNLMKGAAGQAVQNLNVMTGLEETTGLDMLPVFP